MKRSAILLCLIVMTIAMSVFAAPGVRYEVDLAANTEIQAVPVPGKVVIDGKLNDWDLSGGILSCRNVNTLLDKFSAMVYMMHDEQGLYAAAQVTDDTPMVNDFDPNFEELICHRGDTFYMRFDEGGRVTNFFNYFWSTKQQPAVVLAAGANWPTQREYSNGIAQGVQLAYQKNADGKGYTLEMRVPWKVLTGSEKTHQAGEKLKSLIGFYWSGPLPRSHFMYNFFDVVDPDKPRPGDCWWRADEKAWGTIVLSPTGRLKLPTPPWQRKAQTASIEKPQGTIPVRLTIPAKAVRFTIAINDAQGKRIRNLAGDFDPEAYTVSVKKGKRTVEVLWDCLDDDGKLVPAGKYQAVGLSHNGFGAKYEMSFYNPGTPPWDTPDGHGAWGADHSSPNNVTASGDWMIVSWPFAEGGSGLIGLNPDGQRQWGEKRGAEVLACDDKFIYFIGEGWGGGDKKGLCRIGKTDGSFQPYTRDGNQLFPLGLARIFPQGVPGKLTGMATYGGKLVLAMDSGKLAILDTETATLQREIDVPAPTAIAFSRQGQLYGLLDGKACLIDLATGKTTPMATPGLGKAVALAVDLNGNLVIVDDGPDSQVKAYSPQGKLVYTCGKKGGRPLRGTFDEQAMVKMSSVAVDSKGQVWVVENWNYPRRVSVWGRDGKLIRDYIGNTGYGGANCYLHEQDPTLAYCGPIEFKLDKTSRTWKVSQILWVPDEEKGESFSIGTGSNVMPQRFTSHASGQAHEYLYIHDTDLQWGTGHVVFMERNGKWQPVAALSLVGQIFGEINRGNGYVTAEPSGELAGFNAYDFVIWNDINKDGKVQRGECVVSLTSNPGTSTKRGTPARSLYNGWGGHIDMDLSVYTDGITQYAPIGFTDDGAPIYGLQGERNIGVNNSGEMLPIPGENYLVNMGRSGSSKISKFSGINLKTGTVDWTYPDPFPSVHGSHQATMPKPGLIIGTLKFCGTAQVSDKIGTVMLMRGNLGQDFLMTTDGLYVGALFQDGRLPGPAAPAMEIPGMSMEQYSHGGEPFNGWFGKQADGKFRTVCALFARQSALILEVTGLETIQRAKGSSITISAPTRIKAEQENAKRGAVNEVPQQYGIRKIAQAPIIDGMAGDWNSIPAMPIIRQGQPERNAAKLGYDAANLYVLFDVTDTSPWKNEGKDFTRLFKTGDVVDLQFSTNPAAPVGRDNVMAGDVRLVISQVQGKPSAVLMRPVVPGTPAEQRTRYTSPVATRFFDRVEILDTARVAVKVENQRYVVEAAIPLATLGLTIQPGMVIRGDAGVVTSDADGISNTARIYWANKQTNIVSDLPTEAWLYPKSWGEWKFE